METPVYLCGTHAVGTVFQAAVSPRAAGRTTSSSRSWASATTATWPTRGTINAGDVEPAIAALGAEVAEGSVGARHRDGLLRVPRRDRDGVSRRSASITSACCCCATSATASTSTCSGARAARRRPARVDDGSCIAVCATDAPLAAAPAAPAGAAPAAGPRAGGLVRLGGVRRDRARVHDGREGGLRQRRAQPDLRRGLRGGLRRPSTTASSQRNRRAARRHGAGRVPGAHRAASRRRPGGYAAPRGRPAGLS